MGTSNVELQRSCNGPSLRELFKDSPDRKLEWLQLTLQGSKPSAAACSIRQCTPLACVLMTAPDRELDKFPGSG